MERRKLFGTTTTRRRLFSEEEPIRRSLFNADRILVCRDCGYEVHTTGSSTDLICPNCGSSNRFNVKGENRRRLFSDAQGAVQSDPKGSKNWFKCYDCGTHFESPSNTPSGVVCPNCGGLRVVQLDEEQHEDATGELLKEFSGKSVTKERLQKLFTERGINETVESLCHSGYASLKEDGTVLFSENAAETRKLFSELVISVTKELRLIPTEGRTEELIHNLEERGNISPKGIIIVKKAHGLGCPMSHQGCFSDTDSYIEDSGLANDLKLEYSGKSMPLKEFMDILDTQYGDAPDDLLDRLVETGIIKISGSTVNIN
mgnify:CR=1 FL=1